MDSPFTAQLTPKRSVSMPKVLAQNEGASQRARAPRRVSPIAPHCWRQSAPQGLLLGYAALSAKQLRAATALLGECLGKLVGPAA
jgi:hypothetical protein